MKIVHEQPPILQAIIDHGLHPHSGTIYTYGDTIYNPNEIELPEHLIIHEETHMKQQGDDPDGWWGRYLIDFAFRMEQEAEAYANQYDFICKSVKDRNRRNLILLDLSNILSSPMYGSVLNLMDAYNLIKSYVKTK